MLELSSRCFLKGRLACARGRVALSVTNSRGKGLSRWHVDKWTVVVKLQVFALDAEIVAKVSLGGQRDQLCA
jgi:hypothetical protein